MQTKRLLSHKLHKAKADATFFFFFLNSKKKKRKKKLEENLISCETSGFSDPAVPWLRLRKAEIKAAFRAPSLSLSEGGGGRRRCCQAKIRPSTVLVKGIHGVVLLKQCVFTKARG